MAMTKRVRVTFDSKFVAGTNDINEFAKTLVSYSKRFMGGDKTLKGDELALAEMAAKEGVEAAVELSIKMAYSKVIKSELADDCVTVSNIRMEIKQ
ncbi:hypothetical protein GJJPMMHO_00165 [Klebsiella phage 150009]|nr:hypothetical protein GJJPMMHO_00165 [Klebsiella phage 150009]UYB05212.1 hypothetical protein NGDHHFOP_00130 [Klebsiella phage 150016]